MGGGDARVVERLVPGDHLPDTRLVEAPGSSRRSIPDRSRDALVILYLPSAHEVWAGYLEGLAAALVDIQDWYARVIVIVSGGVEEAMRVRTVAPRLSVVVEEEPVLRNRLGLQDGRAAVLIVDRYGQIYHVAGGIREEDLPPPSEIEEWVTFLATQCPECGVIDEPGYGEWALT